MTFYIGQKKAGEIFLGGKKIGRVYLGQTLVHMTAVVSKPIFLEYVENTSGAYINTGIVPTYDMTVKVKYKYTQLNVTFNPIFGMRTAAVGTGDNLFWAGMHYTDKQAYLRFGGNSINYAMGDSALDVIELTANPDGVFINDVDTGARYYDGAMTPQAIPMYLFTINNTRTPDGGLGATNARVYSFEVYDGNGVLIQDLRPALDPNGKVCMYDSVTKKYFYNAGTGELKAGGRFVESIVFDGASYIDTGIISSNNMEFETGVMFSVVQSTNLSVIASRDGEKRYQPIGVYQNKWSASIGAGYDANGSSVSANTKYDLRSVVSNGDSISLYSGNTLVSSLTSSGGVPTKSLYLFARNYSSVDSYVTGRLYYCKIWDNGTLVQDMRPYVDGDGVACLKDVVTDTLFYNKGTGTLTYTE